VAIENPIDEFVSQDELMAPTLFDTRVEQKKSYTQATPAPATTTLAQASTEKQPDLKDLVAGLESNPFAQA